MEESADTVLVREKEQGATDHSDVLISLFRPLYQFHFFHICHGHVPRGSGKHDSSLLQLSCRQGVSAGSREIYAILFHVPAQSLRLVLEGDDVGNLANRLVRQDHRALTFQLACRSWLCLALGKQILIRTQGAVILLVARGVCGFD